MTQSFENAFDHDPFADFAGSHSRSGGGGSSRRSGGSRERDPDRERSSKHSSSAAPDYGYGYEDTEPKESSRRTTTTSGRPRRRASITGVVNNEAEKPREREREVPRTSSACSSQSTESGGGDRRPRRGRRASLVGSQSVSHDINASGHSVDSVDYGYGDAPPASEEDYGYGDQGPAAAAAAPGRRRGRRMSVGGGGAAPAVAPAAEVDYGYGSAEASSYDEKFGRARDSDEGDRPKLARNRSNHLDIEDIKNTDINKEREKMYASTRQLAGAPKPTNQLPLLTVPDVQKNRPRRRASLVGSVASVGGAAVGVVGAVGNVAVGAVGAVGGLVIGKSGNFDEEEARRTRDRNDDAGGEVQSSRSERRRQGTMLERFA